ncbi:succinate--CoA ligase subunit beta [Rhodovibrio sodomensis]|uniref:Succinate--CoA ligase [ADP-forming] subunit beta n=1 Tax=Rhodovibrio sodomensis TaxID=1088 RepID=A0ABS1DDA6_9PROT|nr:malate--CoA ligase subunit beta [Rhodovibrio sodomensis]MBK1667864.1 succinate--CoA ligase subunit beta [Rhodovibrio sodomensis]
MDVHEYQAKELLARFNVPVPAGGLAYSPEQAAYRARELGGDAWVIKAQVHAGGRGKAGGVKLCRDRHEVWQAADGMLGHTLVTNQTGPAGKGVYRLLVEAGQNIARELYLGFVLDREHERIVIVGSDQGGMEIEEIARQHPESMHRRLVDPSVGLPAFQARDLAFALGFRGGEIAQAIKVIQGAYRAFRDLDATMVEINPLVVTQEGNVLVLDCKMQVDDNALYRRPEVADMRDRSQEDPRETHAVDRGLSYVGLDGQIGCIVNGAGLAMATLDMIKLAGGEPANFLDIGGGATPERVAEAFQLVRQDGEVKAILVNIFAGINRCDWVAQGIVQAVEQTGLDLPLVVRLSGTHVEEGRRILADSGLAITTAATLKEAAQKAVAALDGQSAAHTEVPA